MSRPVLLFQVDGTLPNIALMRIASHHRALGDDVRFRWLPTDAHRKWMVPAEPADDEDPSKWLVYASAIFKESAPRVAYMRTLWPNLIAGGTGIDIAGKLEDVGIATTSKDYSIYPEYEWSIGWTSQGCRRNCPFCVVPRKEGGPKPVGMLRDVWRGEPYPRAVILLDNDFFGNPAWESILREALVDNYAVCFTQGVNFRTLTREQATLLALVNYRDLDMDQAFLYGAWDSTKDEKQVFRGINFLIEAGVNPRNLAVYMLICYDDSKDPADWEYRRSRLHAAGVRAFPMVFEPKKNKLGIMFQRWAGRRASEYMSFRDYVRKIAKSDIELPPELAKV